MTAEARAAAERLADELNKEGMPPPSEAELAAFRKKMREWVGQGVITEETLAAISNADIGAAATGLGPIIFEAVIHDYDRAEPSVQALLARTHLAVLRWSSWSAMTVSAGDGYLIGIDASITHALYFLAKLMVINIARSPGDEPILSEPSGLVSPRTCIRLARVYFGAARLGDRFLLAAPIISTPFQAYLAGRIAHFAEVFLAHHEFAHILRGHLDRDRSGNGPTQRDAATQELEADVMAAVILFSRFSRQRLDSTGELDLLAAVCGLRLVFEASDLAEITYHTVRRSIHEPPAVRYQALREAIVEKSVHADVLRMADQMVEPLIEICDSVRSFAPYPRPATRLPEDLAAYSRFRLDPDDTSYWDYVEYVEEATRRINLPVLYHLKGLARGAGVPVFEDQDPLVKVLVTSYEMPRILEQLNDPLFLATLQEFGDDPDDPAFWDDELASTFDAARGIEVFGERLLPVYDRAVTAVRTDRSVSFRHLALWAGEAVTGTAVLPAAALLQRLLREPQAIQWFEEISRLSRLPFAVDRSLAGRWRAWRRRLLRRFGWYHR
ncbi:hypothetical protein [Catellatospora sp. NPDC049133]|uniref:hypothetical protein n=1 Tax=Catellatospora sp. NPDC049133 TaxID=3155499 RepID=UPI0033EAC298